LLLSAHGSVTQSIIGEKGPYLPVRDMVGINQSNTTQVFSTGGEGRRAEADATHAVQAPCVIQSVLSPCGGDCLRLFVDIVSDFLSD
jgi:hypothetical protein